MKIGIATFQWADNYGALLQAFALQKYLISLGHLVEIIDFRPFEKAKGSLIKKYIAKTPKGCLHKWSNIHRTRVFQKFRESNLILSKKDIASSKELVYFSNQYDILITGSDQVWNPLWLEQGEGMFDFYFLSFAGLKTKRISYAASIGHSELATMKKKWQKILKDKLAKFDSISVREKSGVGLIKELCGRDDAVCTVDPTLLLDAKEYKRKFKLADRKKNNLFSFMLHGLDDDAVTISKYIVSKLNIKEVKCNAHKTFIHKGYTLPDVTGWLEKINEARFVVTNSFHCVVFCLLFHTPFVVLLIDGKIGSMNSRIVDLLEEVGLFDRMISQQKDDFHRLVNKGIDWDKVDMLIDKRKKYSIDFLSNQGL